MSDATTDGRSAAEIAREHHRSHRYADAVLWYQRAMRENPLDFSLWLRCGQAAADADQPAVALSLLETYVRMAPRDAGAQFSRAYALFRSGQLDAAVEGYRRAVELDPIRASAWCAIGQIRYMQGDREAGYAAHDAALAVQNDAPLARFSTSVVRLLRGDYTRGWADHEARWDVKTLPPVIWRTPSTQIWDGGPLDGRALHVHAEGGYGDTIMLARFLPIVRARAGTLRFHGPAKLFPLLSGLVDELRPMLVDGELPDADAVHCGAFSLPHLLGTTIESIPTPSGYLAAGPAERPARTPLRVGLVWAGNPNIVHDHDRSIPRFDLLAPLFEVPGVEWTSLQVGPRAGDIAGSPVRPAPPLEDYGATARLLADLDLVISVDTSVAHLAGAMGRPVWNMVPTAPEFRWLLDRDDSPWYASMRLFRRERTDAWPELIDRLARALAERVAT